MKRRFWNALALAGAILFLASGARAQTQTNVTATVKDPLGIPYSNGTYSVQLIPTGSNPSVNGQGIGGAFNGRLDATGSFNIALWPNASISPGGTTWQFTICISPGVAPPLGTGGQCTPPTVVTIAGASQSLSATLSAVAPGLTAINVGGSSGVTGSIALNQIAFGSGLNTIQGTNNFTFSGGTTGFFQLIGGTGGGSFLAVPSIAEFRVSSGAIANIAFTNASAPAGTATVVQMGNDGAFGLFASANGTTFSAIDIPANGDIQLAAGPTNVFTVLHTNGATLNFGPLIIGTDNSAAGTVQLANPVAAAHTVFGSAATSTNTILGFATVPVTGHLVTCTVAATTCTLTDGGAPTSSVALSAITSAVGSNATANGNNPQIWGWAQTTDNQDAMAFNETAAATGGTISSLLANQALVSITTSAASTSTPLEIVQGSVTGVGGFPALQIETTWNNVGLTGQGILFSVTNTASAAGSKLMNLLVGGTSQFTVDKVGNLVALGNLSCGLTGTSSCVITGAGATSGTATITWPAVAGTTTNPINFSNYVSSGTDNSVGGAFQIANGSANAHTIFSSAATTTNTIAGFATAPTTNHLISCVVAATTCTLTDSGTAVGGAVLSSITAAVGANTIANGNNPQTWNWAQTSNNQDAFTFGETSAATGGTLTGLLANQSELHISTASASTATPLEIDQGSVTGTVAFPALQIETTWNNVGLIGQGIVLNSTDTASANNSLLLNLLTTTVSKFSVDKTGNVSATGNISGAVVSATQLNSTISGHLFYSSTAPTIAAAGCGGAAASITAQNGTAAFKIGVGTTPGSACTFTMPAATTGWNCSASDITTQSTAVSMQRQTGAESTTSVTITNFSDVTVATAFVANDVLKVLCTAD